MTQLIELLLEVLILLDPIEQIPQLLVRLRIEGALLPKLRVFQLIVRLLEQCLPFLVLAALELVGLVEGEVS